MNDRVTVPIAPRKGKRGDAGEHPLWPLGKAPGDLQQASRGELAAWDPHVLVAAHSNRASALRNLARSQTACCQCMLMGVSSSFLLALATLLRVASIHRRGLAEVVTMDTAGGVIEQVSPLEALCDI